MTTNEIFNETINLLTEEQQQLLKDTINFGSWGDGEGSFLDENGNYIESMMYGYITNDAKMAGHFSGRKISAMFRSIYRKCCNEKGAGRVISHCSDWWGDGSGDVLFVKSEFVDMMEEWASK